MPEIKRGLNQEFQYLGKWFLDLDEFEKSLVLNTEDKLMFDKLVMCARKIVPAVSLFPESIKEERCGATVVICNPKIGIPPVAIAINEDDKRDKDFGTKANKHLVYALSKAMFSIQNIGAYGSCDNTSEWLNDAKKMMFINENPVPAGSFSLDRWIVSVSGFNPPHIDEAVAIAIHVGAGNTTTKLAKFYANEVNNLDYLEKADSYLRPVID